MAVTTLQPDFAAIICEGILKLDFLNLLLTLIRPGREEKLTCQHKMTAHSLLLIHCRVPAVTKIKDFTPDTATVIVPSRHGFEDMGNNGTYLIDLFRVFTP